MTTALILVDIQNDYFPGGANELATPEISGERAAKALALFRRKALPVFHVRHISLQPGATFFLPDTPGSEIHERVRPAEGEPVVIKHAPDSFYKTPLLEMLRARNVTRLVICGMMSHMCVDTTVRAAKSLGFDLIVVHDACTTMNLTWKGEAIPARKVHDTFMAAMNHTFARMVKVDELENAL